MSTVEDLSDRYANFMISPGPQGSGRCAVCWTPCAERDRMCLVCQRQPRFLDVVLPITFSIDGGPMHNALRGYKDGWSGDASEQLKNRYTNQLAPVLTRFVRTHERCAARAVGAPGFDVVSIVQSESRERHRLQWIVESGCRPLRDRFDRLLEPTAVAAAGKHFDAGRYRVTRRLAAESVLLIDDTWTSGASAQSAGAALQAAGASKIALVVLGRHIRPSWELDVGSGVTNADVLKQRPPWSWDACALET
jgi:predicted amidophosphoribosyltransferase